MPPAPRAPAFRALALALAAPLLTGCWAFTRLDGGPVVPISSCTGCSGSALDAHAALGEDFGAGADVAIRTKFTPDVQQLAVAFGLTAVGEPEPIYPYFTTGIHVLQFESAYDRFAFGMFSPYAELGAQIGVIDNRVLEAGDEWLSVLVGTAIEYDLRFTPQPNEGYWSLKLGVAYTVD
jgi:hypothetical protein